MPHCLLKLNHAANQNTIQQRKIITILKRQSYLTTIQTLGGKSTFSQISLSR